MGTARCVKLRYVPSRHTTKTHPNPPLPISILLQGQSSPFPSTKLRHSIYRRFLPRPTQVLRPHITPPHSIALLERHMVAIRAVEPLQVQHVDVVLPAPAAHGVPVRTDLLEHEARRGALLREDDGVRERRERALRQPFLRHEAAEHVRRGAGLGGPLVLFPGQDAAVVAELLAGVRGVVRAAEVGVGLGEVHGFEMLLVRLAAPLHVACAPAGVDEFPFTAVEAAGVPGVRRCEGGKRIAWLQLTVAESFACAGDHDTFEASFDG